MLLTSQIKQKIISTYSSRKNIELEARFGRKTLRGFSPGISLETFNRIKQYFDSRAGSINLTITDYIHDPVRKSVIESTDEQKSIQTVWITKKRLWKIDDTNYGLRYSVSQENPIQPIPDFIPDIIRIKKRTSYLVYNGKVRIDLTEVNMVQNIHSRVSRDTLKYELEVELIETSGLAEFEKALVVTLQKYLNTIELYTQKDAENITNYVNYVLGSDLKNKLAHKPLVQSRNLKLKDMVWGGLVGNNQTGYSVTHKADGKRKMLVFHSSGIWLVMAPDSLNRLSSKAFPTLFGTILDGEFIDRSNRKEGAPDALYWFLVFDCMAWEGTTDVQTQPHGIRMNHAQAVADKIKTKLLRVDTKTFKNFSTPQEFFKVMRDMFREQEVLTYDQDGFIFTPVNTVYNPLLEFLNGDDELPLCKRNLTKYPDLCKWKPKDELTIDFMVRFEAGRTRLYANQKGSPVLFKGTKVFPFSQDQVDETARPNIVTGSIVEYGWDYENELFVPRRIRYDKTKPNKMDVAEDVWMDINRPLDKDTMEGNTFQLLRMYHNKIKRSLLSDNNLTLLDVGSGRGGDVAKWKRYKRIVAIEPNPEHIEELKRRIKVHQMEHKVLILNTGAENVVEIYDAVRNYLGGRVDVISMMLSMSFFWKNTSMVNRLLNLIGSNIKPGGKVIFLTVDGDLVEQTFEPPLGNGQSINRLDLGPATLKYDGTILEINIEGTIVEDQTEWLVRLKDLVEGFNRFGMKLKYKKRADEEKFLTEEEITMTQMYTYGEFVQSDSTVKLPERENIMLNQETEPAFKTDLTEDLSFEIISLENRIEAETALGILVPDTFEYINVTKYPNEKVVRIGALGDGSCFFHSVLNAYYYPYQIEDVKYREKFVKNLRKDLATNLEIKDHQGKTNWETFGGGLFKQLYQQQEEGVDFTQVFDYPVDFSLKGLQELFDSQQELGNEIYQYAAELLGVNIYVMRLTNKDLYLHQKTETNFDKTIVIAGNRNHYETIGVDRNGLFQTIFESTDPFILSL